MSTTPTNKTDTVDLLGGAERRMATLLDYLSERGYAVQHVHVGDVSVTMLGAITAQATADDADEDHPIERKTKSIYEAYGGSLYGKIMEVSDE